VREQATGTGPKPAKASGALPHAAGVGEFQHTLNRRRLFKPQADQPIRTGLDPGKGEGARRCDGK